MARKQTPDGRRVTVCAKLSEPEAAAVDTARGTLTRGTWLRMAALAYLGTDPGRQDTPQPTAKPKQTRSPRTKPDGTTRKTAQPESAADIMAALRARQQHG